MDKRNWATDSMFCLPYQAAASRRAASGLLKSPIVLISSGCCVKIPGPRWLINDRNFFLVVLGNQRSILAGVYRRANTVFCSLDWWHWRYNGFWPFGATDTRMHPHQSHSLDHFSLDLSPNSQTIFANSRHSQPLLTPSPGYMSLPAYAIHGDPWALPRHICPAAFLYQRCTITPAVC